MKTVTNRNEGTVDSRQTALTLAIAVLVDRIRSLPKQDRTDLFHLSEALFSAENEEDWDCAARALNEILDQKSARVVPFTVEEESVSLEGWLTFVSRRIKKAREEAGLTQDSLEKVTGLPQSHISRLENGVHSPSSATLAKIAQATGKPMAYFDPSHPDD